jgi:serine/threonine-protein kinase
MDQYVGQTILGQFKILEEIGRGGMGSVFKAEQPMMDRLVAVKILHPRLASRQDLVLRFRREARAMSALTHPNTIRVIMFGQMDTSALYIVMEYLDGENMLQVERKQGPIDPKRAANIMIQICGALGEAHQQGIIHRDLKPENIVLTHQGGIADFPKVLDFGLAKMRDPDPTTGSSRALTQQGAVFGTPEFMSPEQARGEVLDARSDIYSLCVILYEMVTCKLPFKAKSPMDYIAKHIKSKPIPVHERTPGSSLDERHWKVMEKALRKQRDDRYQTCGEFAEALKSWLDDAEPGGETHRLTPIAVGGGHQEPEAASAPKPEAAPAKNAVHSSVNPAVFADLEKDKSTPVAKAAPAEVVAEPAARLGTGAKIGIGVGVFVLLIAIVAIVMMVL